MSEYNLIRLNVKLSSINELAGCAVLFFFHTLSKCKKNIFYSAPKIYDNFFFQSTYFFLNLTLNYNRKLNDNKQL